MNRKFKRITIVLLSSLLILTGIVNADLTFAEGVIVDDVNNVDNESNVGNENDVDNENNTEETTYENVSLLFEGDVLTRNENGQWEVNPTASKENPLTQEQLLENLPKNIIIKKDGEETIVPITYDFSKYGESQYKGEHIVVAVIPEETELPEGYEYHIDVLIKFAEVVESKVTWNDLKNNTIDTVSPKGTTINLFDYSAKGTNGDIGSINEGKSLKFNSGNGTGANKWTGDYGENQETKPFNNMVKNKLENGYPILQNALSDITENGVKVSTGLIEGESLDYLFDETSSEGKKKTFLDVQGLLKVEDGYFAYDSAKNFALFNETSNSFTVLNQKGVKMNVKDAQLGNFFPFVTEDTVLNEIFNIDNDGKLSPIDTARPPNDYRDKLNYHFGVHMSTRFIQENGGFIKDDNNANSVPVTYEFSGDDDVWVFIDGVLVADLGGIHNAISLKIDFSSGNIYINNMQKGTLREKFENATVQWTANNTTFADGTYHTLDFFYLERGEGASNMKLKYNLVEIPESDVIKVDQLGKPVAGAHFELYSTDENYSNKGELIAEGTTNAKGQFVLMTDDDNGQQKLVSLDELYKEGIKHMILKETVVPSGYRANEDCKLRLEQNESTGSVIMLSSNYWETGAFASAKLKVSLPTDIYPINPGNSDNFNYENQGLVFAAIQKYIGEENKDDLSKQENWLVVSGNRENGWRTVTESLNPIENSIHSAKETGFVFKPGSSGAYTLDIEDLPGDVLRYYSMLTDDKKSQTEYAIGYYYTSASSLSEANAGNTLRLDSDGEIDGHEKFGRVFASNLLVPNIKNYVLVQKIDEEGNPITHEGATFAIYEETDDFEDCLETENKDGYETYKIKDDISTFTPAMSGDTKELTKDNGYPISLNAAAIFPDINSNDYLETGKTYYLVETKAPKGYKKNNYAIKFRVTNEGIYANAGTTTDGIGVARGVGSLVKTMSQFAFNPTLDATLHDIKARLVTNSNFELMKNELKEPNLDGEVEWTSSSTMEEFNTVHLQYKEQDISGESQLEYGPSIQGSPEGILTQTGWSGLQIKQCLDNHFDDSGHENHQEKTNLGDQLLTRLFSGTVTMVVTDEKIVDLEIQKDLQDTNNRHDDDKNEEFTFDIVLKQINGDQEIPLLGSYQAEFYDSENNKSEKTIIFDSEGKSQITLDVKETDIHNPKVIIKGLPKNVHYTITEQREPGFISSYKVDGGGSIDGNIIDGQWASNIDKVSIVYTNDYNVVDLSFKKVRNDGTGLSGAEFELYRLDCSDSSHTEENHGGLITENGNHPCWTKVGTTYTSSNESSKLGLVEIKDLFPAEYRLVETKAPSDYMKPNGQWNITYKDGELKFTDSIGNTPAVEDSDNGYLLYNYKEGELPLTGYTGTMIFLVSGISLMLIGGVIIVLRNKRRVDKL